MRVRDMFHKFRYPLSLMFDSLSPPTSTCDRMKFELKELKALSGSTLHWQFIISFSVEFAIYEMWNFLPGWHQKYEVTGMPSWVLMKSAVHARMRKMRKVYTCMQFQLYGFFVSVLSFASVTLNLSMASSFICASKSHDECI